MRVKVVASCRPECGVLVQGEVETTSREFIHRFLFPARAVGTVAPPRTEVDEMRLVTFSPDSKDWLLDCPGCGNPIPFDLGISSGLDLRLFYAYIGVSGRRVVLKATERPRWIRRPNKMLT